MLSGVGVRLFNPRFLPAIILLHQLTVADALPQHLTVINFSWIAVPPPVFGVPPCGIAVPPPKVVVPPPGNDVCRHGRSTSEQL